MIPSQESIYFEAGRQTLKSLNWLLTIPSTYVSQYDSVSSNSGFFYEEKECYEDEADNFVHPQRLSRSPYSKHRARFAMPPCLGVPFEQKPLKTQHRRSYRNPQPAHI